MSTKEEKKQKRFSFDDPQYKMSPEEVKKLEARWKGVHRVTIRPVEKPKTEGDGKQ